MNATLFTRIIQREIPAEIVYEDEHTLAFLDIKPNNPGHTLVVPKTPYRNIFDVPEQEWLAVARTVRLLAPILMRAVGAEGVNIKMNNGDAAGQEIPHLHVHLIPRFTNDGHTHWAGKETRKEELARVREAVRAERSQAA